MVSFLVAFLWGAELAAFLFWFPSTETEREIAIVLWPIFQRKQLIGPRHVRVQGTTTVGRVALVLHLDRYL